MQIKVAQIPKELFPNLFWRLPCKEMPSRRRVVHGCTNLSDISAGGCVHNSRIDKGLPAKWRALVDTHQGFPLLTVRIQ